MNSERSSDAKKEPLSSAQTPMHDHGMEQTQSKASGVSLENKDRAHQELRPVPRHYMVQRPRALQYTYRGERIGYGEDVAPITHQVSGAPDIKYTAEGIAKARERIDLFIDLIWVGLISNLTEVYSSVYFNSESEAGKAFLLFILVFLPSWRAWNLLRAFLNSFYMDDTLQRVFIFWILVLSVFFGNQIAYFAEHYEETKTTLIVVYLVIRFSFTAIEVIYSLYIPWLRKLTLSGSLLMLPSAGLWVAAIFLDGGVAAGPAIAAIVWEYLVPLILDAPFSQKFLPREYAKEIDPIHLRGRMGNFLIITIGEGLLLMIKGGPLGMRFNQTSSLAVWSLLIYFVLALLYFGRDGSVRYVPAVRRTGLRSVFFITLHIPIFASFITLSAGLLWLIKPTPPETADGMEGGELTEANMAALNLRALWCIGTSISIIIFSITSLALLDRPLDGPKTLLINNRWVRLAGRPVYIIVILTVLLKDGIDEYLYMGICGLLLSLLTFYEISAGLERPARFLEPKGLTVLMKREYRHEHPAGSESPDRLRIAI